MTNVDSTHTEDIMEDEDLTAPKELTTQLTDNATWPTETPEQQAMTQKLGRSLAQLIANVRELDHHLSSPPNPDSLTTLVLATTLIVLDANEASRDARLLQNACR